MAKPILLMTTSHEVTTVDAKEIREQVLKLTDNEYHVLIIFHDDEVPKFEVLNVDKQPEIDIEELKRVVNERK
jgi:hypothetical protein